MKKSQKLAAALGVLLLVIGVIVFKVVSQPKGLAELPTDEDEQSITLPTVDASVVVEVTESAAKPNAVIMSVTGLNSKYATVGYELTYDSEGLIKGVNSGSKPIEVAGKDDFEREVYMGTCSRNVCRADVGVTKVSVVMEFTGTDGKKSQFTKDYDL